MTPIMHIEVQNSEHAAVSVQLLDSVCASISANVMESEQATVNVKILGSTDTTITSSSKGACVGVMAEHEPVCAAEASLNHSKSINITTEHNYSKVETTHHVWVRFGKSFLTTVHRDEINYDRQLNDQHITYAQNTIKSQFGIEGLQLTLYQNSRKPLTNQQQIIHSRENHWITGSTILSKPGYIDVYDSLYDSLDTESIKVVMHGKECTYKINMVQVQTTRFTRLWVICHSLCSAIG